MVRGRDRSGEFRTLGSADPEGLVLSDARRRRLELESAWLEAVGPGLAARVRCEGVRNGVLDLRVGDPGWAGAVRELLPRIAARMNAGAATPLFRRVRISVDGAPAGEPEPLRAVDGASSPGPEGATLPQERPEEPERRLAAVFERILSRRDGDPTR